MMANMSMRGLLPRLKAWGKRLRNWHQANEQDFRALLGWLG